MSVGRTGERTRRDCAWFGPDGGGFDAFLSSQSRVQGRAWPFKGIAEGKAGARFAAFGEVRSSGVGVDRSSENSEFSHGGVT